MKKSKLDLIYPVDELNINTWKLWAPGKYHKLIELIKIISKKISKWYWKEGIRHNWFTK